MDRKQMSWQMTAEQFAAFDTQLYLDTHPDDKVAMQMFEKYHKNFQQYKKQYEEMFGPLSSVSGVKNNKWMWIDDPWPWELEAN